MSCFTLPIGGVTSGFHDVRQPPETAAETGARAEEQMGHKFIVSLGPGSGADNSLEANTATVTMTFDTVSQSSTPSHS